jgi:hypothetical protein
MVTRAVIFAPYFAIRTALVYDRNALHGIPLKGEFLLSWSDPIELEQYRAIRHATGTTVNDIFLSSIASALRKHCLTVGLPLPKDCTACIPIAMHSLHEPAMLKNDHTFVLSRLPLEIPDPLLRLRVVKSTLDKMKGSPDIILNRWWMNLILNRLPNWVTETMLAISPLTLVASNVPGPQFPAWMCGHKVLDTLILLPHRTLLGIGISMSSYNGCTRVSITMDRYLEGDQQRLDAIMDSFEQELRDLRHTVR